MTRIDVDPKLLDRALLETKISAPIYTAHIENIAGQPATLIITTRDGTTTLPIKTGTVATTAPAGSAPLSPSSAKPNKVGPLSPPPADGGRPDQPPSAGKDTPLQDPSSPLPKGRGAGGEVRSSPDDLTVISGVGQGYARRLHQVGIHTFEDLQTWVDDPNRNQAGIPGWCLDKIRTWLSTRT